MKTIKIQLLCLLTSMVLGITSFLPAAQGGSLPSNYFANHMKEVTKGKKFTTEEFLGLMHKMNPTKESLEMSPADIEEIYLHLLMQNDYERLQLIFDTGLDPNIYFSKTGLTGLMVASLYGTPYTLQTLIDAGANINRISNDLTPNKQCTALDCAYAMADLIIKNTHTSSDLQPSLPTQEVKIKILKKNKAKTKNELDTIRLEIEKKLQEANQKKDLMIPVSEEAVTTLVSLLEELWGKKPH